MGQEKEWFFGNNRKLGMGIAGNMIQVPKGLNVRTYPVAASSCRILCTCLDVGLVVEPSILAMPCPCWPLLTGESSGRVHIVQNFGSYQAMSKENRNTIHPGLELAYYMFIPFYTYMELCWLWPSEWWYLSEFLQFRVLSSLQFPRCFFWELPSNQQDIWWSQASWGPSTRDESTLQGFGMLPAHGSTGFAVLTGLDDHYLSGKVMLKLDQWSSNTCNKYDFQLDFFFFCLISKFQTSQLVWLKTEFKTANWDFHQIDPGLMVRPTGRYLRAVKAKRGHRHLPPICYRGAIWGECWPQMDELTN